MVYANLMAKADEFTASGLREVATDAYGTYVLHRHAGDHADGEDCWCFPLTLSYAQLVTTPLGELQRLLDEHYRVH